MAPHAAVFHALLSSTAPAAAQRSWRADSAGGSALDALAGPLASARLSVSDARLNHRRDARLKRPCLAAKPTNRRPCPAAPATTSDRAELALVAVAPHRYIPRAAAFPRFNAGVVYQMHMQRTSVTLFRPKTSSCAARRLVGRPLPRRITTTVQLYYTSQVNHRAPSTILCLQLVYLRCRSMGLSSLDILSWPK